MKPGIKPKNGYIGPITCIDGRNTHKWEKKVITEEGIDYKVKHCLKCGYYTRG